MGYSKFDYLFLYKICRYVQIFQDKHYLKKVGSGKIRYVNIIARESAIKRLADMFSDSFFATLQKMSRKKTFPTELTTQVEEIIHQVLLLPEDAFKEYDGLLCGAVMIVMQFLYRKSGVRSVKNSYSSFLSTVSPMLSL